MLGKGHCSHNINTHACAQVRKHSKKHTKKHTTKKHAGRRLSDTETQDDMDKELHDEKTDKETKDGSADGENSAAKVRDGPWQYADQTRAHQVVVAFRQALGGHMQADGVCRIEPRWQSNC